jgi:hypothetical protein
VFAEALAWRIFFIVLPLLWAVVVGREEWVDACVVDGGFDDTGQQRSI